MCRFLSIFAIQVDKFTLCTWGLRHLVHTTAVSVLCVNADDGMVMPILPVFIKLGSCESPLKPLLYL